MTFDFNCLSGGDDLATMDVQSFEIAPVAMNEAEDGSTNCNTCAPAERDFWTIYLRGSDGMANAVHDEPDEGKLIEALQAALAIRPVPVSIWFATGTVEAPELYELAGKLAALISKSAADHQPIGDHPLLGLCSAINAALREAEQEQLDDFNWVGSRHHY